MSKSESKASNVLGGKTARACDSCLVKRARWFCAADDAFLCQSCDSTVHSANQLASRHERVRLGTSSFKIKEEMNSSSSSSLVPAWHQGFTRKARTPRQMKSSSWLQPPANERLPLVPEINSEETFQDEINLNDEQIFCRVPVFEDPFGDDINYDENMDLNIEELLLSNCDEELGEFAADAESLLGVNTTNTSGVEEDCGNKQLEHNGVDEFLDGKPVKFEDDDDDEEVQAAIACHLDPGLGMDLNWDLDYKLSMTGEGTMKRADAVNTKVKIDNGDESKVVNNKKKRMLQLRLNYEAVIAAWASQGSPWTDGVPPHFNLDEFLVACLGGGCDEWGSSSTGGIGGRLCAAGREARVSRYREKRRTRLFSKKIRYQVRKLNAEKRPRMKGRFVKRTTFSGSSSLPPNYLIMNK